MIVALAFPRTAKYDQRWIRENALGENALCQAECLARHLPFLPGMRALELGCGKATSSVFLAREFDLQVWACDSGTTSTENFRRPALTLSDDYNPLDLLDLSNREVVRRGIIESTHWDLLLGSRPWPVWTVFPAGRSPAPTTRNTRLRQE